LGVDETLRRHISASLVWRLIPRLSGHPFNTCRSNPTLRACGEYPSYYPHCCGDYTLLFTAKMRRL